MSILPVLCASVHNTQVPHDRHGAQFTAAHQGVVDQYSEGTLGFLDVPEDRSLHRQTLDFAERQRQRRGDDSLTDVVVLGIGGSALGPIALRTALCAPHWNLLDDSNRGGNPRLHVLDNVDPANIAALLARLDLRHSLFVVTSKSGGTAETMAQYLIIRQALVNALGDEAAKARLVFVTDPEKGALRAIARAQNVPALDIPPNVGGRFSVLTPVGLLPAALVGIDISGLLGGAADMRTRCASAEISAASSASRGGPAQCPGVEPARTSRSRPGCSTKCRRRWQRPPQRRRSCYPAPRGRA